MRHRIYGKHLGRDKDQRDNLFKGLVQALLTHGTITTSEAKAKAIKGLIDKVINLAKEKRTQGRLQSFLTDKNLHERLIKEIVPKLGTRTSGYTSLIRVGSRLGDQTMMVRMSLIGAESLGPIEKKVSREERVSQVSRGEKKQTPRGTRGTSKTRDTSTKSVVKKPKQRSPKKK